MVVVLICTPDPSTWKMLNLFTIVQEMGMVVAFTQLISLLLQLLMKF